MADNADRQAVVFTLGKTKFAVDISVVREIIRHVAVTRLPEARSIEGVTSLRGEVIPIIDLRKRLNVESEISSEATKIMVVEIGKAAAGLLVDSVAEVMKIASADIQPPPTNVDDGGHGAVQGVIQVADDLVLLIDIGRILAVDGALEVAAAPAMVPLSG